MSVRRENCSAAFKAAVDDIYTTGTTVSECAKVLKSLGAEKIRVLAFASDFGEEFPKKNPD